MSCHIWFRIDGKKKTTVIEGLPDDLDFKKYSGHLKKTLVCGGHVASGNIIVLTGDQGVECKKLLVKDGIVSVADIVLHHF